jgi:hypothetical protein
MFLMGGNESGENLYTITASQASTLLGTTIAVVV